jgi:hypothetical protein
MADVTERFAIPDDLARAAAQQRPADWLAALPALVLTSAKLVGTSAAMVDRLYRLAAVVR